MRRCERVRAAAGKGFSLVGEILEEREREKRYAPTFWCLFRWCLLSWDFCTRRKEMGRGFLPWWYLARGCTSMTKCGCKGPLFGERRPDEDHDQCRARSRGVPKKGGERTRVDALRDFCLRDDGWMDRVKLWRRDTITGMWTKIRDALAYSDQINFNQGIDTGNFKRVVTAGRFSAWWTRLFELDAAALHYLFNDIKRVLSFGKASDLVELGMGG